MDRANKSFVYLKRGSGMGNNFMDKDIPTAGEFTRQALTLKNEGSPNRKLELAKANATIYMKPIVKPKNLFQKKFSI